MRHALDDELNDYMLKKSKRTVNRVGLIPFLVKDLNMINVD